MFRVGVPKLQPPAAASSNTLSKSDASHKMLVFVSRKNLADTLAKRLKSEGFSANVMHGGKSQDSRLATLEEFRNGDTKLLVTTDVMGSALSLCRGLDIPGISHVVIYDMGDIEDYVHRIGRTARGPYGRGHALTFYEHNRKLPDLPRSAAIGARGATGAGGHGGGRRASEDQGHRMEKLDVMPVAEVGMDSEKASILEAQVQHHLQEEHRLRQDGFEKMKNDVLRLQTLADERGLTVEKVQKREDSSTEKASELQKRLQELQASESLSFARKELDDVKLQGEVARREALRRSDEKVADRDAEIMRLDRELVQCRGHLAQRDKEATQLAMELRAAGLREGVLEQALEQAAKHKVKAEATWDSWGLTAFLRRILTPWFFDPQARRQLQELSAGAQLRPESFAARRHLGAFTDSPGRLRLGRQVDLDGRPLRRAVPPRATSEPRSVNVRSPVRGEQRVAEPLTEPAARVMSYRSILAFQILFVVRSRCSQAQLDLWKRRLQSLDQRQLLLEVWHAWSATAKVFAFRARLELVLLDELRLAKVREEDATRDAKGFAESKLASLKSFIFEFRQRVAESVAELPGASQAAYGLEGSQALVKTLELGRGAFGRLLHAALFLYQKLRSLLRLNMLVTPMLLANEIYSRRVDGVAVSHP
eukprot:g21681.t1